MTDNTGNKAQPPEIIDLTDTTAYDAVKAFLDGNLQKTLIERGVSARVEEREMERSGSLTHHITFHLNDRNQMTVPVLDDIFYGSLKQLAGALLQDGIDPQFKVTRLETPGKNDSDISYMIVCDAPHLVPMMVDERQIGHVPVTKSTDGAFIAFEGPLVEAEKKFLAGELAKFGARKQHGRDLEKYSHSVQAVEPVRDAVDDLLGKDEKEHTPEGLSNLIAGRAGISHEAARSAVGQRMKLLNIGDFGAYVKGMDAEEIRLLADRVVYNDRQARAPLDRFGRAVRDLTLFGPGDEAEFVVHVPAARTYEQFRERLSEGFPEKISAMEKEELGKWLVDNFARLADRLQKIFPEAKLSAEEIGARLKVAFPEVADAVDGSREAAPSVHARELLPRFLNMLPEWEFYREEFKERLEDAFQGIEGMRDRKSMGQKTARALDGLTGEAAETGGFAARLAAKAEQFADMQPEDLIIKASPGSKIRAALEEAARTYSMTRQKSSLPGR